MFPMHAIDSRLGFGSKCILHSFPVNIGVLVVRLHVPMCQFESYLLPFQGGSRFLLIIVGHIHLICKYIYIIYIYIYIYYIYTRMRI